MAVDASRIALARAGLGATDLDLIIVATSTPDHLTPPVSSQVQHALGAGDIPAFVVVTGCTGFVYALTVAYQFIATGACRTVLVAGVELLSRFVNWQDRATAVLFGDGAGAVVVQATAAPCGLSGFALGSDGSQKDHIILPDGGSARPFSANSLATGGNYLYMNGREVFKFATRVVGKASHEALCRAGLTMGDVDWVIPHQANLRILQAAAREMGVPMERFVVNIDRYANTSAASIPLALAEALDSGTLQLTDTLLLVAFGAGLTWGAAVLQPAPLAG
jgi:3-oxoacyl-[acyl-carrier-protein] synthase-3